MKKIVVFMVIVMMVITVSANAELLVIGSCNASSREGWNITEENQPFVSEWLGSDTGDWYSHISCAATFDDVTVAFAVTLVDGTILSEEEVYSYLDELLFSGMSVKKIVEADVAQYGIIEGIFGGVDQIDEAVDLTISIHEEKEEER